MITKQIVLILMAVSSQLALVASAIPSSGRHDRAYRDSLRAHIFEMGSAEVNCLLSYPIGDSVVDPGFGENASELAVLHRFLRYAVEDTLVCVRQVSITGRSSLDGSLKLNERLSLHRVNRLLSYLDADYHLSDKYPVKVRIAGADWARFRELIAGSDYLWKEDALRIVDGPGKGDWKKIRMAYLGNGDAHARLYGEIYPKLRQVEIWITYDVQCMKTKMERAGLPLLSGCPTNRLNPQTVRRSPERLDSPLFAVKTNLLFDLALMPNIEVEIPMGRRWSLNGEYMFPWWLMDNDRYCLQLISGGVELRYWLGNRHLYRPLTGHFAGLYAGGGKYDLQWKADGYQGEFFIAAGLSYGYSLPLSRHWNMEFNLGIGLLRTDYRHYQMRDNYETLLWRNNGCYTWFGPTKAKISLVWLLGNRKGGRK